MTQKNVCKLKKILNSLRKCFLIWKKFQDKKHILKAHKILKLLFIFYQRLKNKNYKYNKINQLIINNSKFNKKQKYSTMTLRIRKIFKILDKKKIITILILFFMKRKSLQSTNKNSLNKSLFWKLCKMKIVIINNKNK